MVIGFSWSVDKKVWPWLTVLAAVLLCLSFFNTAWVSDDAYISFRSIRNFVDGYGPVWNLDERVQVYTHPLWFFVVSFFSLLVGDEYWAALLASFFCLLGVIFVGFAIFRNWLMTTLFLLILSLSRFFIDYSSSGLENPLSHLLLCFIVFSLIKQGEKASILNLCAGLFSAALLVLNRMDLALLGLPITLDLLWKSRSLGVLKVLGVMFLCSMPILIWLMFSFYYYGSPFPNTYFAKVSTGIDQGALLEQGLGYFSDSFLFDPVGFLFIVFSLFISFRYAVYRSLAFSIFLYCAYIASVGGDFMVGRFLSAPFLLAALVVVFSFKKKYCPSVFVCVFVLAFFVNAPVTLLSLKNYEEYSFSLNGVADERGFYYKSTGLKNNISAPLRELHHFSQHGFYLQKNPQRVVESCYIGMLGYYAPRETYILDGYGLTDPFLSRLPALSPWRIGHFERPAPSDYYQVISGEKRFLTDQSLNALLQDVFLVHRGGLNEKGRLEAIFRLSFGGWEQYISGSGFVSQAISKGKTNPYACRNKAGVSLSVF